MGFVERQSAANGTGQSSGPGAETPQVGFKTGRVGAPLEEIRTRLLSLAERLSPIVEPHALPLITEATRVLQEQTCRIAVIGQIKAGKSSFINAFTHKPNLLPTDINPWTAVVTSLHFRNERTPPQHQAVFKLFSRDEWQRIAEGGGRLRELTERLVPGFAPDLLRAQLEVMRQRVEQRLGSRLDQLLGQTHTFDSVSQELLDDYISAGTYLTEGQGSERLQLSDITRSADLYLQGGPFAVPAVLIDTPGTNDPFLVRDEITRRALDGSDIYVFVISALQPLAAQDISLLRILNGLHKDRIIVYINRIDQLRNPLADTKAVRAAVKTRLEREFPAVDIPVVAGSAWWGGLSLMAEDRDVARLLPPASTAYLREFGLPPMLEGTNVRALAPEMRIKVAGSLYMGSGIPAVAAGITELLCGGSNAVLLRQLATCFLELTRATEITAKMELQSVLGLLDAHRAETRAVSDRIRLEREALTQLDQPIGQIQSSFELIERQLKSIVATDIDHLASDLRAIVDRFARDECSMLMSALRRNDHDGEWHTDLAPLREDLETRYVEAYRDTEARIIEIEKVLYPQLRTIVDAIIPGGGVTVSDDYAHHTNPHPSISPLTETLVLDLDVPWWKAWFASRPDPARRAADMLHLIHADFLPLIESLVRESRLSHEKRIQRTLSQAQAVSSGMLSAIQQRKAQVVSEYEALNRQRGGTAGDFVEQEQQAKAEKCAVRHAALVQLIDETTKLNGLCQQFLSVEARAQ